MREDIAITNDITDPPEPVHPIDDIIRTERIPHVWCPGCGIGTSVNSFTSALEKTGIDLDKVCVVSGIGCTGRVAGYVKLDSFHTTHGRAIPFAVGLKLANPELNIVVYSGDGDITAIGGNHFIHAARRNIDLTVICVNNFIYGMTGGQMAPTTPMGATSTTSPYGNLEHPFNIPYLAAASGAVYVARWTSLHVRRLEKSMMEALKKPGFAMIEVISPCPTVYGRRNKLGDGMSMLKFFHDNCEIRHGEDPANVDIDKIGKIIVGKFVDIEKPTYSQMMRSLIEERMAESK
ncbi:MAG: 2-oxoacid:ferredoxin oxidoreductase subunit beta [Candidatus Glassbacteria bacterium]